MEDEFIAPWDMLKDLPNILSYASESFSPKFKAHSKAHNTMSDDLMKDYASTQAGTPFDIAKNYAGGYDYGYRSPDDIQRAINMARWYQLKDVVTSPLRMMPWNYGKEYNDAKNDFLENVQGIRAGASAKKLGVDYDPELIKALSKQYATGIQRKARGGLVQMKQCNCGSK